LFVLTENDGLKTDLVLNNMDTKLIKVIKEKKSVFRIRVKKIK
jgi:hypothetical protein